MQFIPEILLICLLIFLYSIFSYAKDNFILLRKNVTLEQIFNMTFLCFFFGVFVSRIFYVLENPNTKYFNPLVLLMFPYFPGLSFAGGIAGGFILLFYLSKKKKQPFWNIFDICSLSFIITEAIGILLVFVVNAITLRSISLVLLIGGIISIVLFIIMTIVFSKNILKDGSTGFFALVIIISHQLIMRVFLKGRIALTPEDILLGALALTSIFMAIIRENPQGVKKK